MRIIVYQTKLNNGKVSIAESTGEHITSSSISELLRWLITDEVAEYVASGGNFIDDCIRVCWSLDDTVAPLLRLIGKTLCQDLYTNKKIRIGPYSIFYIPGKIFSFKHASYRYKLNLFGLDQYYPEEPYQDDMLQIEFFGRYLLKTFKQMGMSPTRLTSPIKVYEQNVMDYLDLPTVWDMPAKAGEFAWYCSGKLWVEAHKVGYWDMAYDYDIVSAFPTAASRLFDTRGCEWVNSSEYQQSAVYGYCKCKVTIFEGVSVSPIIRTDEHGKSYSPVGTWETYLTKMEIIFIRKFNIGEAEIIDGWWAIPKQHTLARPLEAVTNRLLDIKAKGGLRASMAKRISVGMYGKVGEEHTDSFGKHFNPCWFAEISSIVRLRVAAFVYKYGLQDSVIHISVDGVLSDRLVEIESKHGKGEKNRKGNWVLSSNGPALVLSSGLIWQGDKKPNGMGLESVKALIEGKPRGCYWEAKLSRRVTLGQALEGDFEGLGKEREMHSNISLNVDRDRYFAKTPATGHQLLSKKYSSEPIKVTEERKEANIADEQDTSAKDIAG